MLIPFPLRLQATTLARTGSGPQVASQDNSAGLVDTIFHRASDITENTRLKMDLPEIQWTDILKAALKTLLTDEAFDHM